MVLKAETMQAQFVECDRCGLKALVRVTNVGMTPTKRVPDPVVTQIVDCPSCGIHEQPATLAASEVASSPTVADIKSDLGDRVTRRR